MCWDETEAKDGRRSFHLLSLFTMNSFFWENLVLIGVLFVVIPFAGRFLFKVSAQQ